MLVTQIKLPGGDVTYFQDFPIEIYFINSITKEMTDAPTPTDLWHIYGDNMTPKCKRDNLKRLYISHFKHMSNNFVCCSNNHLCTYTMSASCP